MKNCPACYSDKIKQTSSIFSRILIAVYIFLAFLFFIGGIHYQSLLAFVPLIIPYKNICLDCNNIFYRKKPKFNKDSVVEVNTSLDRYLVAMLPSILMILLLIIFFPYTGLSRIIYLPFIFLLNSVIIMKCLILTKSYSGTTYLVTWLRIIILTIILTIVFYPQEYGPHVIKMIFLNFRESFH